MLKSVSLHFWTALFVLSAVGSVACGARPGADVVTSRLVGFHIDMNIAQFRGPYLKQELKELAARGYNAILWEVENNIRWQTCPECVSPDAFSIAEFKDILAYSRALGLEPIPLLQTIGHCEYVLKNERYRSFAEVPERIDQYCPRNPEVLTFLQKWIDECLEVFGPVRYFHLGADEAYTLGQCPLCRAYAAEHSLSELYIDHINALSRPLVERGIRPAIWGDMVLHHPEALDKLSRKIMIFDWLYDRYDGCGTVQVWGRGSLTREELDASVLERFGAFLYPLGDEPGRDPDPFYTSDFLAANGFDVVVCPSSSCYGDSVFAPRTFFHMRNTADSFRRGFSPRLKGAVLTSWTVHLFPWELQGPSIGIPGFLKGRPAGTPDELQKAYTLEHFGLDDPGFFIAAGLLAKRGLFNYAADLGFFKDARPAPIGYVSDRIEEIAKSGRLEQELADCETRLGEYRRGLALFQAYVERARSGHEELMDWILAARNLVNRAEASRFLLRDRLGRVGPGAGPEVRRILEDLRTLRRETEAAVARRIKPARTVEIMGWIFDSTEAGLAQAEARAGGR